MKRTVQIKIKVTLTDGYRERFTQACLDVIKKREAKELANERIR
jgi:hypothetical protein